MVNILPIVFTVFLIWSSIASDTAETACFSVSSGRSENTHDNECSIKALLQQKQLSQGNSTTEADHDENPEQLMEEDGMFEQPMEEEEDEESMEEDTIELLSESADSGDEQKSAGRRRRRRRRRGNCPAGHWGSNCAQCIGETRRRRAQSCYGCPAGQGASPNNDHCVECGPGTFPYQGWCMRCDGSIRRRRGDVCTACEAGSYKAGDADGYCHYCGNGQYQSGNACHTCVGSARRRRANACTACPAGSIDTGSDDCAVCGINTYQVGGSCGTCVGSARRRRATTCTSCPPGFEDTSADDCVECGPGLVLIGGQCTPCNGAVRRRRAETCTPCANGLVDNSIPSDSCMVACSGCTHYATHTMRAFPLSLGGGECHPKNNFTHGLCWNGGTACLREATDPDDVVYLTNYDDKKFRQCLPNDPPTTTTTTTSGWDQPPTTQAPTPAGAGESGAGAGAGQECDWRCYLDRYPLVKESCRKKAGSMENCAAEHYKVNGAKRNFDCTCRPANFSFAGCDWKCYMDRYRGLKRFFGTNYDKAATHYDQFGYKEGRLCYCPGCDWMCYLDRYPEVAAMCITENHPLQCAEDHWKATGVFTGKNCKCPTTTTTTTGRGLILGYAYDTNAKNISWQHSHQTFSHANALYFEIEVKRDLRLRKMKLVHLVTPGNPLMKLEVWRRPGKYDGRTGSGLPGWSNVATIECDHHMPYLSGCKPGDEFEMDIELKAGSHTMFLSSGGGEITLKQAPTYFPASSARPNFWQRYTPVVNGPTPIMYRISPSAVWPDMYMYKGCTSVRRNPDNNVPFKADTETCSWLVNGLFEVLPEY